MIIGIRYMPKGKVFYSEINGESDYKVGDDVIGESEKGLEIGKVVLIKQENENIVEEDRTKNVRKANKYDLDKSKEQKEKAKAVTAECKKIARKRQMDMKIISAKYLFDESKLIIFFVAEQRIDFRELVKELATIYKTRIELRQIGARDELKLCPNVGPCGRETCCQTFLDDFEAVTIKNAKEQGLQINMAKLSGNCGKLMCCLKYEEEIYKEKMVGMPKYNETVKYQGENAKVAGIDILRQRIKLKIGNEGEERFEQVELKDIQRIKRDEKRGEEDGI